MINTDKVAIQSGLLQLDQALDHHNQWYDSIIRTLICRLPFEPEELDRDAHRHCMFGQWYYQEAAGALRLHPGFVAIETEHRRMHHLASLLLRTLHSQQAVSTTDFDAFARTIEGLRLQIFTLKREMEDTVYNLDELTGASNRLGMLTTLREQQELVKRHVQSCCVVMMDIDHFKNVNDTYGHLAGDRVLASSAQYLMHHLRPYDKLFRYGGEEFLLCLPDTDLTAGHAMTERLRQGLSANPVALDGQDPIRVTMSFGITRLDPDTPVEKSIAQADEAMYEAKQTGRNRTQVWNPAIQGIGSLSGN